MALPRAPAVHFPSRLQSAWWALALPLPIAVVVVAIAVSSDSATFLTYLALLAVPPLAAAAMALLARGSRPPLALLVMPLFAIAWAQRETLSGELSALILSGLACVTLGWMLASAVAARWIKLGIYAMALIDAWLVGSELLQGPNSVLNAAAPAVGLPRLQLANFGSAVMGFGDLFIAAVLGGLLARERSLQLRGAALAAAVAVAFDLLFFRLDTLPATVPIAVTLALLELFPRRTA